MLPPGLLAIGVLALGVLAPGLLAHGVLAPGFLAPGLLPPGLLAPGLLALWVLAPGLLAPGLLALGVLAPGLLALGLLPPGLLAPGLLALELLAPGLLATGLLALGFVAPGLLAPGLFPRRRRVAYCNQNNLDCSKHFSVTSTNDTLDCIPLSNNKQLITNNIVRLVVEAAIVISLSPSSKLACFRHRDEEYNNMPQSAGAIATCLTRNVSSLTLRPFSLLKDQSQKIWFVQIRVDCIKTYTA